MKPAHELGLKFRFHYRIIWAESSRLSRGEERKQSNCEDVTHECERDVRATMPRSRAATSAGVGKLTVMLAGLLILPSTPQF